MILGTLLYGFRHKLARYFARGRSHKQNPHHAQRAVGKAAVVTTRAQAPTPPEQATKKVSPPTQPKAPPTPIAVKPAPLPPPPPPQPLPSLPSPVTPPPHAVLEETDDNALKASILPEVIQSDQRPPGVSNTAWEEIRQKQQAEAEARQKKSILNEDAPDMFEIAAEHPESYGNPHYGDTPPDKK